MTDPYSTGYNNALDDCIAAVQASPTIEDLDGCTYIDVTVDTVLADIRALQQDKT